MRKALVYVKGTAAAELTENVQRGGRVYRLRYLPEYLALPDAGSVCMALPRRKRAYESESLFPYFESILPEGDFARRVCREGRLDRDDRFGMLLALAHTDALGDVTVVERRDEA